MLTLPRHSTGRGGAGSIGQRGQNLTPADISKLSIEERDAYQKMAALERPVMRGGRGGAGNIREDAHAHSRGRDSSGGGMFGSMLRSLSRAARGEGHAQKEGDK